LRGAPDDATVDSMAEETVEALRAALAERDRLLRGLGAASRALLELRRGDGAGMARVLGLLGASVGVARAYVFENDDDPRTGERRMSQRFEWAAGAVDCFIDDAKLQGLPYALFDGWYPTLSARRPVQQWTRQLSGYTREIMDEQGILVLLLVPIFVEGRFWGFIGLDNCEDEEPWAEAEIEVLGAFADTLGATLVRHRVEARLAAIGNPVIQVFDRTLVLPLHGLLAEERVAAITRDLLEVIHVQHAVDVLIDLTGVPELGSQAAAGLARVGAAARLIGARCTLVGLSAAVAAELVGHAGALGELRVNATLADGLRVALAARGLWVTPIAAGAR
jgi:anti-anti-sigma regulatory factor